MLKFHTTVLENETLSFQPTNEFGVSCSRCVYGIQRDKGYQKREYVRNILNNSCDKTFGLRFLKNCLHKLDHIFDSNNDKNFYNWIIRFCFMDHFHAIDFIKDYLIFLLVTETNSCPIYGSYFFLL